MARVALLEVVQQAGTPTRPEVGASVYVYRRGAEVEVAVFDDEVAGEELDQPLVTDQGGRIRGANGETPWLEAGLYDILVAGVTFPWGWPVGGGPAIAEFGLAGSLILAGGQSRFRLPSDSTIIDAVATVGTAPTGASIKVDVNLNGTTIFTTQANRPTIAAGAVVSGVAKPDVTAASEGDYLTVDIDQVGSTIAGGDLVVQVMYERVS